MIFSLLPAFLATLPGTPSVALGLIEGVAEATASTAKVVSGRVTDRISRKKPLVLAGYGLSSAVRPLIALAAGWPAVLILRFLDRIGKGIRSAPRDTLIASVTPASQRGAAYGLHRAFDNTGAFIGPRIEFTETERPHRGRLIRIKTPSRDSSSETSPSTRVARATLSFLRGTLVS